VAAAESIAMRRSVLALTLGLLSLTAPASHARPAAHPPERRLEPEASLPAEPGPTEVLDMICIVGGLIALIALMPEFDGGQPGDWDRQEGDDEDPR
jgi:hypothetical protein